MLARADHEDCRRHGVDRRNAAQREAAAPAAGTEEPAAHILACTWRPVPRQRAGRVDRRGVRRLCADAAALASNPDEAVGREYLSRQARRVVIFDRHSRRRPLSEVATDPGWRAALDRWPLPNVWLGVSVEDQQRADERKAEGARRGLVAEKTASAARQTNRKSAVLRAVERNRNVIMRVIKGVITALGLATSRKEKTHAILRVSAGSL